MERYSKGGKAERQSNYELLRVVAIWMIIAYHIVRHCIKVQLTDLSYVELYQTGYFNQPVYFGRLGRLAMVMSWGGIANSIFVLITGYYLAGKPDRLKLEKRTAKLLEQFIFASVFLVLVPVFVYKVVYQQQVLISLINLQKINSLSWYIGYYLIILLIAGLCLNQYLAGCNRYSWRTFLLVAFAFMQFSWSGKLAESLAGGLRTVLLGVFLYALGGYLHRYNPLKNIRWYTLILILIGLYVLGRISYYNTTYNNIMDNGLAENFVQKLPDYANYNPVVIAAAVCLFELFGRMPLPAIREINFLGGSTLMVYLLHDNRFCYSIWDRTDWISLLWQRPWMFVAMLYAWVVVTWLYGLIGYGMFLLVKGCLRKWWQRNAADEA